MYQRYQSSIEPRTMMMTREDYYAQIADMYVQRYESKDKEIEAEDRRFREYLMRSNDRRFREYLMHRNDDDDETDWWYRSEKENPEEQALDDEELVKTVVVTESDGIDQQTVNNEENANGNLDILEEESIIQSQVPVSSLESSLQFHNASSDICDDFKSSLFGHQEAMLQVSHVKVRDELLTKSTDVTNNQAAHYLFDKMPLRMQSKRRHIKCHKSWRFKFKHRVALMKKNKFSITWPMLKDDCFIEEDQVSHETLPLWLLIRSKFRKFKFRNKNFQKMMREHGHFSHLKLKSDMGEDDEMFTGDKAVSMRFLLAITPGITENNAGQGQQAVFEQILMVNEWQHQISLVLQQVMRSKKIRLSKRWWFKYRFDEEDQGSLQSRAGHSLSRREILTFISQAKALLFESKDWREKQIPTLKFLKQINISHYRWIQEVFAVIGFLLRRQLQLTFNCEEPELAGRKRNHGLFIRLHSKQKQRKCPKSWMYKFKMDSEPAGTSYLKRHKECGICAQIRGAKKQSKLLLLSLCPSFICRAMLRVTVKQRKHSKTWSFKYKQQGNFRLLRCVGERTRKDIVTVTSCRSYGLAEFSSGDETLSVDPAVALFVAGNGGGSPIVRAAFERYMGIIFKHASGRASSLLSRIRFLRMVEYDITSLKIVVHSDSEELQLGVDESYTLMVSKKNEQSIVGAATIEANTVYGALRGLETFSQLCAFDYLTKSVQIYKAPWYIQDKPRFKYRGLLIDTSRHYLPIDVIKQIVESMSFAKLNVLHWHIVDEQSFPLETPTYPNLWKGAYSRWERYTVEDASEIVRFAKMRGINVMAEVDVPGHAESWGTGYPDLWPSLSCREPLDVTKNFTFDVISGILADMRKIFPFELFHLGGDEVNTDCWKNTTHVKEWLHGRNFTTKDAYKYFVLRAQQIAISKNWTPVNWEETFSSFGKDLDPRTVVQNWLVSDICQKAVAKGFRCIFSDQGYWYLDHLDVPWHEVYNTEPLNGIEDPSLQKLVIGGEVCMWGETADTSVVLQTIWPRAAAAAERMWSTREAVSKGNITLTALPRLHYFRCLLNNRGVPAAPVDNWYARRPPSGPGSCYAQ